MAQLFIICLAPFLCKKIVEKGNLGNWLSPVLLCFGIGILLANFRLLDINPTISNRMAEITVLTGLPLLLYATNIKAWLSSASSTILSFMLFIVCGLFCSIVTGYLFADLLPNSWQLSGMLIGVYTGGLINLQAIGMALGVSETTMVILTTADVLAGGLFIILVTSVAHKFYGLFLKDYTTTHQSKNDSSIDSALDFSQTTSRDLVKLMALTLCIIIGSAGLSLLFFQNLNTAVVLLLLTTFSILASFSPNIRQIPGSFVIGDYLLLMFCVAIGMLADFSSILDAGWIYLLFTVILMYSTIALHLFCSKKLNIDRDTTIIIATACTQGPYFIGQVASAIKNREMLLPGIITSLIGFAIGNYLGLAVAYFLQYCLT